MEIKVKGLRAKGTKESAIVKFALWIGKRDFPFFTISISMIIMLLWAGLYKMTVPGADGIVPLVTNSPLFSWDFKLFGVYPGSDFIGITEWVSAILILIGMFKPIAGIFGGVVAVCIFFVTSSMLLSTPGALTVVKGISYMSFLGLFLFKDIIGLGASFYLISYYGKKTVESKNYL
jgi:uncharacterized membrane protein YkgB